MIQSQNVIVLLGLLIAAIPISVGNWTSPTAQQQRVDQAPVLTQNVDPTEERAIRQAKLQPVPLEKSAKSENVHQSIARKKFQHTDLRTAYPATSVANSVYQDTVSIAQSRLKAQ